MFVSGSGGQFKEICGRARCTKAIQDTAESLPTLWLSFSTALSFEAYQSLHEGEMPATTIVTLQAVSLEGVFLYTRQSKSSNGQGSGQSTFF